LLQTTQRKPVRFGAKPNFSDFSLFALLPPPPPPPGKFSPPPPHCGFPQDLSPVFVKIPCDFFLSPFVLPRCSEGAVSVLTLDPRGGLDYPSQKPFPPSPQPGSPDTCDVFVFLFCDYRSMRLGIVPQEAIIPHQAKTQCLRESRGNLYRKLQIDSGLSQ